MKMYRKNGRTRRASLAGALLLAISGSLSLVGCGGSGGEASAPTITAQSSSQTALAGNSVTLSVTATGESATYQWYKDSSPISGATSASYAIAAATTSDSGAYYVVVSNESGSDTSDTIALTVSAATGGGSVTVN